MLPIHVQSPTGKTSINPDMGWTLVQIVPVRRMIPPDGEGEGITGGPPELGDTGGPGLLTCKMIFCLTGRDKPAVEVDSLVSAITVPTDFLQYVLMT